MNKIFTLFLLVLSLSKLNAQCSANFTYTLNSAGNVTFSNTSISSSTNSGYYWDFGDYTNYSYLVNPTHTYAGNGIYFVTLYLYDTIPPNVCNNTITQSITITNTACLVSANISTIQLANGVVYFADNSTGTLPTTTYSIDFGDNTSSNSLSSHTYSASGNYTITYTASNLPSCFSTYTAVINVLVQACTLTANFTYSVNGGTVTFTDTSVGTSPTTTYYWNFGSNQQSPPAQTYTYNGIYSVTLMIHDSINFSCYSSITKTIAITNASCFVNSSFILAKDSTQMPAIVWNAYPTYPTNVVSAIWTWGDNTSTNALYPTHTYSAAGLYSICLTVSVSCGGQTTTCMNSNIYRSAESNAIGVIRVLAAPTGIKNNSIVKDEIRFQPNPSNGSFAIKNLNKEFDQLIILNQLGQQTFAKNISDQAELNLDLDLPNGIYFVQLSSASGNQTRKISINK